MSLTVLLNIWASPKNFKLVKVNVWKSNVVPPVKVPATLLKIERMMIKCGNSVRSVLFLESFGCMIWVFDLKNTH